MLTAVVGLVAALTYGAADFLGGTGARRLGAPVATAIATATGLVVVTLVTLGSILWFGQSWSAEALLLGGVSSLAGSLAILLLYAALAIGPMSILSPLTAVLSAVVPMVWGFAHGERLGPWQLVGLALALVAVVLVGFIPGEGAVRPRPVGLALATASGMLIGVFVILLDAAPDDSFVQPVVGNRVVGVVLLAAIAAVWMLRRRARGEVTPRPDRRSIAYSVGAGLTDPLANGLILYGLAIGQLTVMSVLIALYPAGTILLAAIVHRERVAPVQWVGLALALGAAGLLAVR